MTDITDFNARYERYRQAEIAASEHNKAVVFDALAAAGITSVAVTFDGYGDSGQIENIEWQPAAPPSTATVTLCQPSADGGVHHQTEPETLSDAVEELCYAYLGQDHGGWQDNDGSFGEFVFDVVARTVELTFNRRFTDHETTEHRY